MKNAKWLVVIFEAVLDGVLAFGKCLVGHVAAVVRQVAKLDLGHASLTETLALALDRRCCNSAVIRDKDLD